MKVGRCFRPIRSRRLASRIELGHGPRTILDEVGNSARRASAPHVEIADHGLVSKSWIWGQRWRDKYPPSRDFVHDCSWWVQSGSRRSL